MDNSFYQDILDITFDADFIDDIALPYGIKIPLFICGKYGIYVFFSCKRNFLVEKSGVAELVRKMKRNHFFSVFYSVKTKLSLPSEHVYYFLLPDDTEDVFLLKNDTNSWLTLDEPLQAYNRLADYNTLPQVERLALNLSTDEIIQTDIETESERLYDEQEIDGREETYVKELFDQKFLKDLRQNLCELSDSFNGIKEDEDGNRFVQKVMAERIGTKILHISFIGEKKWYRLSERDADRTALKTFLFGLLGLHKLDDKNVPGFLFYLFTCGGFCFGYIYDLIRIYQGNYHYSKVEYTGTTWNTYDRKEEIIFLESVKKRKTTLLYILLSIPISLFMFFVVYKLIYSGLAEVIATIMQSTVNKNEMPDMLNNVSEIID